MTSKNNLTPMSWGSQIDQVVISPTSGVFAAIVSVTFKETVTRPSGRTITEAINAVKIGRTRELCNKYRILKKRSSPYHPEGDGISERPIGVMNSIFRSKIVDKKLAQRKWTDIVPEV